MRPPRMAARMSAAAGPQPQRLAREATIAYGCGVSRWEAVGTLGPDERIGNLFTAKCDARHRHPRKIVSND